MFPIWISPQVELDFNYSSSEKKFHLNLSAQDLERKFNFNVNKECGDFFLREKMIHEQVVTNEKIRSTIKILEEISTSSISCFFLRR